MKAAISRTLAMTTATVGLVSVSACCVITCPSPCSPHSSSYLKSRTVTLLDGQLLARFDFVQTVHVEFGDECPADDHPTGAISLSITNLTAETASFGYTVTDADDNTAIVWAYSGQVTLLAPGATANVGLIANSTVPLAVGLGPRVEVTGVLTSGQKLTRIPTAMRSPVRLLKRRTRYRRRVELIAEPTRNSTRTGHPP
jgi:hypothetical protein